MEVQTITQPERINPMVRACGKGPEGARCKTCVHFIRKSYGGTYFKCEFRGNTNGPGTDHRANWPACSKYFPDGKTKGIEQAVNNADRKNQGWSDLAFKFLVWFLPTQTSTFMAEDIRIASLGKVPIPPSDRAWGAIILRASKAGLIKFVGYGKVTNPKAHSANAAVWQKTT
jgi:hypothetical protein